jgi:uncharacterized surface protein with fasciclin (FAS1) repeats
VLIYKLYCKMMKKDAINPLKLMAMLTLAIALVFVTSCSDDEEEDTTPEPTENIMQLITNYPENGTPNGLDSLVKYLNRYPNLVGTLESGSNLTLFAPSNTAFIGLLATPGFPQNILDINPDIVEGVLAYHVATSVINSETLVDNAPYVTAQGENIAVNADGTLLTGATNQAIEIVEADLAATNGVVHITGSVMIPPTVGASLTPILGTNAGTLLLGAAFSNLAEAIQVADAFAAENNQTPLTAILSGETTHTVFAPTNETFAAAGLTASSFTGQEWYGIIANHVILEEVTPADITGPDASTLGVTYNSALPIGMDMFNALYFFNAGSEAAQNGIGVFIDSNGDFDPTVEGSNFDAEVALPDAAVNSNGRVHVIAGVLTPPGS